MTNEKKSLPIYMTDTEKDALKQAANEQGLSMNEFIKEGIELMKKKHELAAKDQENIASGSYAEKREDGCDQGGLPEYLEAIAKPNDIVSIDDIYTVNTFVARDNYLVYIVTRKDLSGKDTGYDAYLQKYPYGDMTRMFSVSIYQPYSDEEHMTFESFKKSVISSVDLYINGHEGKRPCIYRIANEEDLHDRYGTDIANMAKTAQQMGYKITTFNLNGGKEELSEGWDALKAIKEAPSVSLARALAQRLAKDMLTFTKNELILTNTEGKLIDDIWFEADVNLLKTLLLYVARAKDFVPNRVRAGIEDGLPEDPRFEKERTLSEVYALVKSKDMGDIINEAIQNDPMGDGKLLSPSFNIWVRNVAADVVQVDLGLKMNLFNKEVK